MPEKVTISHRGARYEIGMGRRYYAIWAVGAPRAEPVDRWPETPEGWSQAWARFSAIETPGTIAPVPRKRPLAGLASRLSASRAGNGATGDGDAGHSPGRRRVPARLMAIAALAAGVVAGIAGLFPDYFTGQSLADSSDQLVPHILYIAGWAIALALISSGGVRTRIGGLLGTGLSAVTFGLFVADLANGTSPHVGVGAGMVVSLIGWLACATGAALAVSIPAARASRPAIGALPAADMRGPLGKPRKADAGPITLLALCALGAAITFLPSWDSYTLTQSSSGSSQTVTAGNAFQNPGWVIFGDVATVVALVAVAVLAAIWRPARHGAALLAGAIVAMGAQAISALIQSSQPAPPEMFGISAQQAQLGGLTISSGLTSIFWVYVVFLVALAISAAWLLAAPASPVSSYPAPPNPVPANPAPADPAAAYPPELEPAAPGKAPDDAAAGVSAYGESLTEDAPRGDSAHGSPGSADNADSEVSTS